MGGLIWLILGIGFCLGSLRLKIGGLHNPGAGFIPFLVGALLCFLGLALIITSFPGKLPKGEKDKVGRGSVKGNGKNLLLPFLTLLILVGYVLLSEPLGFLLSTFFFLFFLFKLAEPKKWLMPFTLSLSTVILSFLLFSVWLQSQFPRGVLGF
jgi:putative tricarboxylic transport membrane protein